MSWFYLIKQREVHSILCGGEHNRTEMGNGGNSGARHQQRRTALRRQTSFFIAFFLVLHVVRLL